MTVQQTAKTGQVSGNHLESVQNCQHPELELKTFLLAKIVSFRPFLS